MSKEYIFACVLTPPPLKNNLSLSIPYFLGEGGLLNRLNRMGPGSNAVSHNYLDYENLHCS